MIHNIVVEQTGNRFCAHLKSQPGFRSGGDTINEALAALVIAKANELNLDINLPRKQIRKQIPTPTRKDDRREYDGPPRRSDEYMKW